ncbi:hypothetical protein IJ095_01270 [Candidatus Saccharibacteria bacterium]|nr:hypothetical protein [Candidatus Saccharibacteria bacterium]
MEFDEKFLKEVGLTAMGEEEQKAFLEYMQEELEVRIGEEIAAGMSETKMREFETAETDEAAEAWLKANKPDYKEIVRRTIKELKEEVARNRERILA